MRWDAIDKNVPNLGDRRKVAKFAFVPTLVEDKYVWLEFYWILQEYVFSHRVHSCHWLSYGRELK